MRILRKLFSGLLLFQLLLSTTVVAIAQAAPSFPDVLAGSLHFGAVEYLKSKGVVSGYPDGTFKPDNTINRAEALKIVMIASGGADGEVGALDFPDVASSDWFHDFVGQALSAGIVEGYEDGTFKPGNNINVAESLKIIFLAFEQELGEPPTSKPYPDVDVLAWYSSYAHYAKTKQFIWPDDRGRLNAGRDITRGEFAQIIYRLMYTEENNLSKFPLSKDWKKFVHPSDNYEAKYPYGWQVVETNGETIFWKEDEANGQLSWYRVFPNSATLVVTVDPNEDNLSFEDYVNRLQYANSPAKNFLTLNGYPFASVTVGATLSTDYFFELSNGEILVAYSQLGGGDNSPYLAEEIRNIIGSVRYNEDGGAAAAAQGLEDDAFLTEVRKLILIEGDGQQALDFIDDLVLVETDTIGIGTGPVDYYFSANFDVTLKYERDSDTLLAMSDGNTTAF